MGKRERSSETVTRVYTINLGRLLHKRHLTFKERAPKAVKAIRKFAAKEMKTSDVRLDVKLNKAVWSRVRGVRETVCCVHTHTHRERERGSGGQHEGSREWKRLCVKCT